VDVNISNSSSDSGENISVAGYIFFKHPKFTQCSYFCSHPRRHLPASTPYFDIGYQDSDVTRHTAFIYSLRRKSHRGPHGNSVYIPRWD
jgi:hypothetical protein